MTGFAYTLPFAFGGPITVVDQVVYTLVKSQISSTVNGVLESIAMALCGVSMGISGFATSFMAFALI